MSGDGEATCWGRNDVGQASPPLDEDDLVGVWAGLEHNCALRGDRTAVCWGSNGQGQSAPPEGEFDHLALTEFSSCGLLRGGDVVCWGGDTPPLGGGPYRMITAGRRFMCGLTEDGTARCAGAGIDPAQPPAGRFDFIGCGYASCCAVRADGSATCWGRNDRDQAEAVGPLTEVAMGLFHACGVGDDGRVRCWGDSRVGAEIPPTCLEQP